MGSPQSHVVVAPFPFGSHSASLLSLITTLTSVAPSSHFSFLSTRSSLTSIPRSLTSTNINFLPISDGQTKHSAPQNLLEEIDMFIKTFKESLRDGMKTAEVAVGCKVSCVISHAFLWMAGDVAKEMGVKWVSVWTGGPHTLLGHLHTDLIRETIGVGHEAFRSYGDKKINFVPGLSNHRPCDLSELIVGNNMITSPFHIMVDEMAHRLHNSDAIVLNTIKGLDPAVDSYFTQKFTNYLPTGPLHLLNSAGTELPSDPYGCLSWLDQHEPATVVYISIGTLASLPPSELTALANGLEASGMSFIWSLKENMLLPPGFLDRINETGIGKIVSWAPQKSVLEHNAIGVFVSHCGWNSVMESMAAGVPIICRPFFGDQMINAREISQVLKFGITLDGGTFTEVGVTLAIKAVLNGEEGENMRNNASQLKNMVNVALTQHGSSKDNLKRLMKIVFGC